MKHLKLLIALIIILIIIIAASSLLPKKASNDAIVNGVDSWSSCLNSVHSYVVSYPPTYTIKSASSPYYAFPGGDRVEQAVSGCEKEAVFISDGKGEGMVMYAANPGFMDTLKSMQVVKTYQLPQGIEAKMYFSTEGALPNEEVSPYPIVIIPSKNMVVEASFGFHPDTFEKIIKNIIFN